MLSVLWVCWGWGKINKNLYLVQPVTSRRVPARLEGIVRQVEAGYAQQEAVPGHHASHHIVTEVVLPVEADVGHRDDAHVHEYSYCLSYFPLADGGHGFVPADAVFDSHNVGLCCQEADVVAAEELRKHLHLIVTVSYPPGGHCAGWSLLDREAGLKQIHTA